MNASELISRLPAGLLEPLSPNAPVPDIEDIACDSRRVRPGTVFVASRGVNADGHAFLGQAVRAGAAALVGEDAEALRAAATPSTPAFVASDSRRAMAEMACALYGHPSREMDVIGVTGTNGKTTTVHLIERLYAGLGFRTGRIGTLGTRIGGEELEGAHTTPEAPDLQRTLRQMADVGVQKVAMEVSSHALAQDRSWGTAFSTVVFTNLTQDHLDYHAGMEDYFQAKRRLFTEYGQRPEAEDRWTAWAIVNADDPAGRRIYGDTSRPRLSYGLGENAELRAVDVVPVPGGSTFQLQTVVPMTAVSTSVEVRLRLPGLFNVYNALAAYAAVSADPELAGREEQILDVLGTLAGAPGRFESVDRGQEFAVLVDYAHTPDALENVLRAAREITQGRVLAVFGCGGDRDRTKRPLMGRIATRLSDFAYATSDNPRTEDPNAILADVTAGMDGSDYVVEPDRRAAISRAIADAQPGDTVVIAGKGHEDYQIIGMEKRHFDDREVAAEALEERGRS